MGIGAHLKLVTVENISLQTLYNDEQTQSLCMEGFKFMVYMSAELVV